MSLLTKDKLGFFDNRLLLSPKHQVLMREESMLISAARVRNWLLSIAALLFVVNLAGQVMKRLLNMKGGFVNAINYFFDASLEGNFPTLFSVLLLGAASGLLFVVFLTFRRRKARIFARYWLILSLLFLFMMVDEATQVHEQLNKLRGLAADQSGFLYYIWVIPYAALALAVGLYFLRFLLMLPARTKIGFLVSGVIFISGAIGFEMLEGRMVAVYGVGNLYDSLFCAVEELLEMTGVILLIYYILDFISGSGWHFSFLAGTDAARAEKTF